MPLKELQDHMKGNKYFLGLNKDFDNMNDRAQLRAYRRFLVAELDVVLSPDMKRDVKICSVVLTRMTMSSLFEGKVGVLQTKYGDLGKVELDSALDLIQGEYTPWLMNEFDDVQKTMDTLAVQDLTGSERTGVLKQEFTTFEKEQISKGMDAGVRFQKAKADKTALKEEVKKFLGVKKFGTFSALMGTVTDDAIHLLEEEKTRINQEIENTKNLARLAGEGGITKDVMRFMQQGEKLIQRRSKAQEYIEQLRERQKQKTDTLREYDDTSKKVLEDFGKLDLQFKEQNTKFIKGIEDIVKTLRAEEEIIRKKKEELDKLVADIDSTSRKLWEEKNAKEEDEQLVQAKSQEIKKLLRTGGTEVQLKAIEKSTKKLGDEKKKLLAGIPSRESNMKKMQAQLDTYRDTLPVISTELALIDTRYSVLRQCVDTVAEQQRDLVSLRNELREELDWMKKLKTVDTGLAVYCSYSKVCFPLLLNIGKLAAGESCGPLGPFLAASLSGLSMVQKVGSSTLPKDIIMGDVSGMVGIGLTTTALAKIRAYDTGSFNLNLALGLSVGKTVGGAGIKGGLALVYSAGFTQEDDRRFRTICTLTVEAYGEFEIPELVEAEIKAELLKETSGMSFQDVFHWAAWLAQKWANIAAMIRASKFFDVTDEYGMPTDLRKRQMMDMAKITMANDPQLFKIFQETMKYVSLPVVRMECMELAAGLEGSVTVAKALGAGFSVSRLQDPKYYKRVVTEDSSKGGRRQEVEYFKEGKQHSQAGWVMALVRVDFTYSSVIEHAVVDNEGESWTFNVTLEGLSQQTGFQKPGEEIAGPVVEWVEKALAPVVKVTKALPTDLFNAIQESTSLGCFNQVSGSVGTNSIQICLYRSKLSRGDSKLVLMYWRPVFETNLEASAEIETGVPGLNIDLSLGASLTRTYSETLGTNTLSYLQMVFNGFMNITDFDKKPDDEPRPEYARGTTLWKQWTEQHNNNLYLILKRVAEDKDNKEWVTREVLDQQGGIEFVRWLRGVEKKFKEKKSLMGKYNLDKDALKQLKDFLYASWKSKDYNERMKKGWEPVPVSEFHFSLSPIVLAREIARSRTQAYKLDSALRSLGPRKGLKELYAEEARARKEAYLKTHQKDNWVADEDVDRCANCSVLFSLTVRRHHCRVCGKIFCSNCLPYNIELPERGYSSKEKVCAECYQKIMTAREEHEHGHGHQAHVQHQPQTQLQAPVQQKDLYGIGKEELAALKPSEEKAQHTDIKLLLGKDSQEKKPETGLQPKEKSETEILLGTGPSTGPPEKKQTDKESRPVISGFKEVDAGGEGDCLFRSVAMAVFGRPDNHLELRRMAVQHMEGFKASVRNSLEMEVLSDWAREDVRTLIQDHPLDFVDRYLTDMKRAGTWGGAPELRALCRVLKKKIVVHRKENLTYPVFVEAVEENDQRFRSEGAPIHILYVGGCHYKCLTLMGEQHHQQQQQQQVQQSPAYEILAYHGTTSKYRDSLGKGLKPMTSVWHPDTGGELGPGFYTTTDYESACVYGAGMAGAKGGGVDVWALKSLIPLKEMQGHGIARDQQWGNSEAVKKLCDQYHYFFNADEKVVTQLKFNEWTYPLLKIELHSQMTVDEAFEKSKTATKTQKKN